MSQEHWRREIWRGEARGEHGVDIDYAGWMIDPSLHVPMSLYRFNRKGNAGRAEDRQGIGDDQRAYQGSRFDGSQFRIRISKTCLLSGFEAPNVGQDSWNLHKVEIGLKNGLEMNQQSSHYIYINVHVSKHSHPGSYTSASQPPNQSATLNAFKAKHTLFPPLTFKTPYSPQFYKYQTPPLPDPSTWRHPSTSAAAPAHPPP